MDIKERIERVLIWLNYEDLNDQFIWQDIKKELTEINKLI